MSWWRHQDFEIQMFKYAKANTAMVNVFINTPFASKILVDEKMSIGTYVSGVSIHLFQRISSDCCKLVQQPRLLLLTT